MTTLAKLLTASMLLLMALLPANATAQIYNDEGPVITHRQLEYGVAGELQTFIARVSANTGVDSVTLHYRIGANGGFHSIPMRPLVDAIGEYMIAVETPANATGGLHYYIEATDKSGTTKNQAFNYAPFVIPLVKPTSPTGTPPTSTPSSFANNTNSFSGAAVAVGIGAALILGALASGGGDAETPSANRVLIPLTIITDQPTAE